MWSRLSTRVFRTATNMAAQNPDNIFRNLLNSIAEQQQYQRPNITIKPINSGGANYTSKLFQATISAQDKEDMKLFGKVALMGPTLRSQVRIRLFETEIFVYNELANIYETMQEAHGVPIEHKLVFPKLYGYNETVLQETVVLEDLTARGFKCMSRFDSIDWPYAAKAVQEMAKLHALCIAFAKENPEQFQRLMGDFRYDPTENIDHVKSYWKKLLTSAVKACTEENGRMLERYYENMDGEVAFIKMRRTLRRPILVHSDFRPSNLMHKVRQDGSVEIIVVDYQTVQAGCPVYDLLFFLMTGSDSAFRREHQDELIENYYRNLCDNLKRLHLDPEEEYPRSDFDHEWNEMLPCALTMAIFSLPIITVEEENAPVIDHNTDMNGFTIGKTSQLFSERINQVIDDFKNWGILK